MCVCDFFRLNVYKQSHSIRLSRGLFVSLLLIRLQPHSFHTLIALKPITNRMMSKYWVVLMRSLWAKQMKWAKNWLVAFLFRQLTYKIVKMFSIFFHWKSYFRFDGPTIFINYFSISLYWVAVIRLDERRGKMSILRMPDCRFVAE